jgi:ubiquitin-conjugating enzyme E2 D/E
MANQRILKEIDDIYRDPPDHITAGPIDDDHIDHWEAVINAPNDCDYRNGVFLIDIKIPSEYPYKPPICKFKTKILHPNINENDGSICLNILNSQWNPSYTISNVLSSILTLLYNPNFDNPFFQKARELHLKEDNDVEYKKTIQEWIRQYSGKEQFKP